MKKGLIVTIVLILVFFTGFVSYQFGFSSCESAQKQNTNLQDFVISLEGELTTSFNAGLCKEEYSKRYSSGRVLDLNTEVGCSIDKVSGWRDKGGIREIDCFCWTIE